MRWDHELDGSAIQGTVYEWIGSSLAPAYCQRTKARVPVDLGSSESRSCNQSPEPGAPTGSAREAIDRDGTRALCAARHPLDRRTRLADRLNSLHCRLSISTLQPTDSSSSPHDQTRARPGLHPLSGSEARAARLALRGSTPTAHGTTTRLARKSRSSKNRSGSTRSSPASTKFGRAGPAATSARGRSSSIRTRSSNREPWLPRRRPIEARCGSA